MNRRRFLAVAGAVVFMRPPHPPHPSPGRSSKLTTAGLWPADELWPGEVFPAG